MAGIVQARVNVVVGARVPSIICYTILYRHRVQIGLYGRYTGKNGRFLPGVELTRQTCPY